MTQNKPKLPFDGEYSFKQAWLAVRECHQQDAAPYMKRKVLEYFAPRLAFWVSIFSLTVHYYWASITHCGVNFQRGGAIIVFAAATLYAVLEWHDSKAAMLSGRPIQRLWFNNPAFLLPLLGAVGTLVWGYGDLLPVFGSAGCAR